jgi:carboxyl-terminal processing protease
MERWQKYLIAGLAVLVASFGIFSIGYSLGDRGGTTLITAEGLEGSDLIQEAYDRILSGSVDDPDEAALARGAIKGMVQALKKADDPYALFYSPKSYQAFQELTTGRFSGIGVWLKPKGKLLQIVSVLPDTPALDAGLRRGDVIESIDGQDVTKLTSDEAINLIKGPSGSEVALDIDRSGERLSLRIERAEIDLPNLQARITEDEVGYIRLFGFARNAGDQVRDEIESLRDKGAEGIVLDLRDNGGGLFSEAIAVASVFIEDGEIVTYRSADEGDIEYEAEGEAFEDLPLVVLVNEGTASASEIVAGALQDRDRAVLIGETTYGKGSVQEVIPLSDASAMKFTTAAYLTPNGRDIDGRGISPDVEVAFDPASRRDIQLDRAVEILQGIVLSGNGTEG